MRRARAFKCTSCQEFREGVHLSPVLLCLALLSNEFDLTDVEIHLWSKGGLSGASPLDALEIPSMHAVRACLKYCTAQCLCHG